jgi:hypothetical protein
MKDEPTSILVVKEANFLFGLSEYRIDEERTGSRVVALKPDVDFT